MSSSPCLRNRHPSWPQKTPLPDNLSGVSPVPQPSFQPWHRFDDSHQRWTPVQFEVVEEKEEAGDGPARDASGDDPPSPGEGEEEKEEEEEEEDTIISLVTWNVDAGAAGAAQRMAAVLSGIATEWAARGVDVLFFQEVSPTALRQVLGDAHIRQAWYASEADDTTWREGQPFTTMTLLSRRRFGGGGGARPGPLWRLSYPSRFGRDALCCDVFVAGRRDGTSSAPRRRVRLINVHLDSLPLQPSKRPLQIAAAASLLRCAGRGLVAGDFNPVLPEDEALVADNHLVDAWPALRGRDPGFTWGRDGRAPFPPARLDKVALLGLRPHSIDLIHPGKISVRRDEAPAGAGTDKPRGRWDHDGKKHVFWSDHSGIRCSFGLIDD